MFGDLYLIFFCFLVWPSFSFEISFAQSWIEFVYCPKPPLVAYVYEIATKAHKLATGSKLLPSDGQGRLREKTKDS